MQLKHSFAACGAPCGSEAGAGIWKPASRARGPAPGPGPETLVFKAGGAAVAGTAGDEAAGARQDAVAEPGAGAEAVRGDPPWFRRWAEQDRVVWVRHKRCNFCFLGHWPRKGGNVQKFAIEKIRHRLGHAPFGGAKPGIGLPPGMEQWWRPQARPKDGAAAPKAGDAAAPKDGDDAATGGGRRSFAEPDRALPSPTDPDQAMPSPSKGMARHGRARQGMVGHGRAWWGKAGMVGDSPSRVVVVGRRMGLGIIIPQARGPRAITHDC